MSLGGRTTKGPKQDRIWLRSSMHDGDEPWLHYL